MDFDNNLPIYIQVVDNIKKSLVKGTISLGEKLPSTRELAITYKINPNTASRVYKELESEEICYTKRGLGTYITESSEKVQCIRENMADDLVNGFITGMRELNYSKYEMISIVEMKYKESGLNDQV